MRSDCCALIDFGSAGALGAADYDEATGGRSFPVQTAYASDRLLNTSDSLDEEDDFHALMVALTRLHLGTHAVDARVRALVQGLRQVQRQQKPPDAKSMSLLTFHTLQFRADLADRVIADLTVRLEGLIFSLGDTRV